MINNIYGGADRRSAPLPHGQRPLHAARALSTHAPSSSHCVRRHDTCHKLVGLDFIAIRSAIVGGPQQTASLYVIKRRATSDCS